VPLPDPLHADAELVDGPQTRVEEADDADQPDDAGAADRALQLPDQFLPQVTRERVPDRCEQLLLQERVAGQHQREDRGDQQEDGEQTEEREVRDTGGHQVALGALVAAARPAQVVEPEPPPAERGDPRLSAGVDPGGPGVAGGAHRPSLRPDRGERPSFSPAGR
jgi:hypothetical protein